MEVGNIEIAKKTAVIEKSQVLYHSKCLKYILKPRAKLLYLISRGPHNIAAVINTF